MFIIFILLSMLLFKCCRLELMMNGETVSNIKKNECYPDGWMIYYDNTISPVNTRSQDQIVIWYS